SSRPTARRTACSRTRSRPRAGDRGHHRGRRRRRPPPGDDRGQDGAAGDRCAGTFLGAERSRLAAVNRADAARRAGRDGGDRQGGRRQRGAPRRAHPRRRRSGNPRTPRGLPQPARSRGHRSPPRRSRRRSDPVSRTSILPGSTIGVVGGGQLGRMLALEARRMGYHIAVLDPAEHSPAAQLADHHIRARLDDQDALARRVDLADVVTLEWENAHADALRALEEAAPIRPGPHVLEVAQHRARAKDAARKLGLPTADYRAVDALADLESALGELGTPAVLKTCRGGYDARGQRVLRSADDAAGAYAELGGEGVELILEAWVPFRLEASVLCARNPSGEIASFPVGENVHRNGILDFTLAPARISPELARQAREIGEALVEGLD